MLLPTLLVLLAVSSFSVRVAAFSQHPTTSVIAAASRSRPLRMAVAPDAASSEERLKEDIAALKEQAASRLESLLVQMEELKELNNNSSNQQQQQQQPATTAVATPSVVVEPEITTSKKKEEQSHPRVLLSRQAPPTRRNRKQSQISRCSACAPEMTHAPASLLDDTVWKIVFQCGTRNGHLDAARLGRVGRSVALSVHRALYGTSRNAVGRTTNSFTPPRYWTTTVMTTASARWPSRTPLSFPAGWARTASDAGPCRSNPRAPTRSAAARDPPARTLCACTLN